MPNKKHELSETLADLRIGAVLRQTVNLRIDLERAQERRDEARTRNPSTEKSLLGSIDKWILDLKKSRGGEGEDGSNGEAEGSLVSAVDSALDELDEESIDLHINLLRQAESTVGQMRIEHASNGGRSDTTAGLEALRKQFLHEIKDWKEGGRVPGKGKSGEGAILRLKRLIFVLDLYKAEHAYFANVRIIANEFWDAVAAEMAKAEITWLVDTDEEFEYQRIYVQSFEDAIIRNGYPREFDAKANWLEAAQNFVPGLDRLVQCQRTVDRRKGLRVLHRTLRDTEVGLYDGKASYEDLQLMNLRRETARRALAWLLRQPCPPCRPTDALRREVLLMAKTLGTSPMGDPNKEYLDAFEEEELISNISQSAVAPPIGDPSENEIFQRPVRGTMPVYDGRNFLNPAAGFPSEAELRSLGIIPFSPQGFQPPT